jgi:ketosteroid isomerase-like protein
VSRENVEIVQTGFDAFRRGDLPAMLESFASDVLVTTRPDQPDVRDFHGHDGLLEQLSQWVDTWDGFSIEILRLRDEGNVVIVIARERGQGMRSRVPMDDEVTFVFTVEKAKVVRWQMFGSEPEALRAAGLAEDPQAPR